MHACCQYPDVSCNNNNVHDFAPPHLSSNTQDQHRHCSRERGFTCLFLLISNMLVLLPCARHLGAAFKMHSCLMQMFHSHGRCVLQRWLSLLSDANVPLPWSMCVAKMLVVAAADLGCLDHAYFTTETRRLISRATSAQHAVYRNVQNCGRAGTSDSDQAYGILSDVIANLNSYKSSMEEEVPFEAEHVLQELYNLDAVVQGVQAGTWERNTPQEAPRRYSADDAEDMSDDDVGFDECTWDVAANSSAAHSSTNRNVSKTPGRPPPHRSQRRARHGHARRS
ncbi:hypothetical protein ABBQ32_003620 [Trebouxia sp. C0010 RCD-2024]